MTWDQGTVAALSAGAGPADAGVCNADHHAHQLRRLTISLDGPAIGDWPGVPAAARTDFPFDVYDADRYRNIVGYCPGDDDVSRTITLHGSWEGFETALVLAVLTTGPGTVVDVGCQVGWYTILAARTGHPVIAVDVDAENLRTLHRNADLNDVADLVTTAQGWIGPGTGVAAAGRRIRLLKADVEGAEDHAVRAFGPSLGAGEVDYLLLELTDQFGDGWRGAVEALAGYGYTAYRVPGKTDHVDLVAYAQDPLRVVAGFPLRDLTGAAQVNALFVRGGLR